MSRRLTLLALLLAAGCRGSRGSQGASGTPGGPGGYANAPRVFDVSPATFSWGVTVTIGGVDFASGSQVLVGGLPARIVSVGGNQILVDHAAPADLAASSVTE